MRNTWLWATILASAALVGSYLIPALTSGALGRGTTPLSPPRSSESQPVQPPEGLASARGSAQAPPTEVPAQPTPQPVVALSFPSPGQPRESIREKLVHGWVMDSRGLPAVGARITPWRRLGLAETLDQDNSARAGTDGHFEVMVDHRGTPRMVIEHAGHLTWEGDLPSEAPVTIQLAETMQLVGRVIDVNGQPASNSLVRFDTQGPRSVTRELRVDRNGRFEIDGLRPEPLMIRIRGPHGSLGPVEVEVQPGMEPVLQLGSIRCVRVHVTDEDGLPLQGARVVLMPTGQRYAVEATRTNAAGEARFEAATTDALDLSVEHGEHQFETVALAAGNQELSLKPIASGAVNLTSDAKSAILVELSNDSNPGGAPLRVILKPGEELRCSPLAPGPWTVSWSHLPKGGQIASLDRQAAQDASCQRVLLVEAGVISHLAIEAPQASVITGVTSWKNEQACAIELHSVSSENLLLRIPLGPEGSFRVEDLAAGHYRLAVCASGGGRWLDPRELPVTPGERLQVTLDPRSSLREILVRDMNGAPLSSARGRLKGPEKYFPSHTRVDLSRTVQGSSRLPDAIADEFGRIQLEFMPPGLVTVIVSAPGFKSREVQLPENSFHITASLGRL